MKMYKNNNNVNVEFVAKDSAANDSFIKNITEVQCIY